MSLHIYILLILIENTTDRPMFCIWTDLEKFSIASLAHGARILKINSMDPKSCVFVINKLIIKTFLTSNCWFWLKYESSTHNIAFSNQKEIYAQIKLCLQVKTLQNSSKEICCGFWCERTTGDGFFSLRESVIVDYGLTSLWVWHSHCEVFISCL